MANEKRLIDAKPLMQNGWHLVRTGESNRFLGSMSLADVPPVDAVEVVHGRWLLEREFEDGTADYKCSACDYDDTFNRNLIDAFYKYCPYCGAKMDGDGND